MILPSPRPYVVLDRLNHADRVSARRLVLRWNDRRRGRGIGKDAPGTRSAPRCRMSCSPHAVQTPTPATEVGCPGMADFDLVVADASWSWTERLFSPLAELGVRVLLLKACDWCTALAQRRPARDWLWPARRVAPGIWEKRFILPPGWMKTYP